MDGKRGKNSKGMRALKTLTRVTASLSLPFVFIGCFYSNPQNSGTSGLNNPYLKEKIDADHPPSLVIGSKFIYQDTNLSNGKICKLTMAVEEKKEFEGKPAYWIDVTREGNNYFDIYDMNLNWIGSFSDGKELESAEPCIRVFKWPLKVGKKWNISYTLRDYSQGIHVSTPKVAMNIRAYEEATVPAGTFETLRIQAGGETFWYAPSIGWVLKEQIGPYGKDGWLLELMEYSIPQK